MNPEFKIGDEVRCVGPDDTVVGNDREPKGGGYGWERGLVFRVTSISGPAFSKGFIYYNGGHGGVWESFLELADKPTGIVGKDPREVYAKLESFSQIMKS